MNGFKSCAELELDSYTIKLQQLSRSVPYFGQATVTIIKEIQIVKL